MIPSKEDFLAASCRWNGSHNGIGFELNWHGRSDYNQSGTWCCYILISDEQFYPDDWAKLRLERDDIEFAGSWRRHWNYDNFPDLGAHRALNKSSLPGDERK